MRRTSRLALAAAALLAPAGCGGEEAEPAPSTPPNVVLIIADDLAWDDVGAYGNPAVRTPNLDRMAGEGMRFQNAFVTISSCSPSRASILTGRYPHNTDAEQLHWPVPAEQVTFVERLREAGYWAGAAGKWHLGDAMLERFDEVRDAGTAGFQYRVGPNPADTSASAAALEAESGNDQWIPLLRARPKGQPFFLWLASLDPHRDYREGIVDPPTDPSAVRVPPYLPDLPEVRAELALYYDEIARLDRYVGEVLAELERQGVADNTLVLFLSDNGRPFPRAKTTLYDSGIRTPLIAWWPGRIPAGAVQHGLVSTIDIAPTVLALAGLSTPPALEGVDLGAMLADTAAAARQHVFAEKQWHDYEDQARAVRSARYKYIRNFYPDLPLTPPADAARSPTFEAMKRLHAAGRLTPAQRRPFIAPRPDEELYDLEADPHELINLVSDPAHAGALRDLRDRLAAWRRDTGDALPASRTPDEFDRVTGEPLPNRIRPRPSKAEMLRGAATAG